MLEEGPSEVRTLPPVIAELLEGCWMIERVMEIQEDGFRGLEIICTSWEAAE